MPESPHPTPDYRAALEGVAWLIRRGRRFLGVTGKAPGEMLNGLLSNRLPPPLAGSGEEGMGSRGSVVYSALLNPKGRMISDLRVLRDPVDGFLLDLPAAGWDGAIAHFKKFLPPRLAATADRSDEWRFLTVMGPEAPYLLAKLQSDKMLRGSLEGAEQMAEGEELLLPRPEGGVVRVIRNDDFRASGWDLMVPASMTQGVEALFEAGGASHLQESTLEILRVERGRPLFGRDMDESTIPVEAGIQARAVDHGKGCYTGQEVIIRIRDRGQVNKALRGLLLGDSPPPPPGSELYQPGREKSVGWITTSVSSPHFGQTVALGYLKRGVGVGEVVRVGGPNGPQAHTRGLGEEGWILD
jgi:folate-binding protein YgfZ